MTTIEAAASPMSETTVVVPATKKNSGIMSIISVLEDIIGGIIDLLLPGGSRGDDGDAYQS